MLADGGDVDNYASSEFHMPGGDLRAGTPSTSTVKFVATGKRHINKRGFGQAPALLTSTSTRAPGAE